MPEIVSGDGIRILCNVVYFKCVIDNVFMSDIFD